MSKFVLDASVVLAVANREPGHEGMVQYLLDSAISAVNLSEVVARTAEQGVDIHAIRQRIRGLRLDVVVFDEDLAFQAACARLLATPGSRWATGPAWRRPGAGASPL